MGRMIAISPPYLLRHFFSLVVFGVAGCLSDNWSSRCLVQELRCELLGILKVCGMLGILKFLRRARVAPGDGWRAGQQGTTGAYRGPQPLLPCQGPEF